MLIYLALMCESIKGLGNNFRNWKKALDFWMIFVV